MNKITQHQKEVFTFLNELRDSGVTNMFGATPYIQEKYGCEAREAMQLLKEWMENYNPDGYGDLKIEDQQLKIFFSFC